MAARPDLALVDGLARLVLEARRAGWTMRVHAPGPELRALIDLVGLTDALGVEVIGESEGGEEISVEEVRPGGDPTV